MTPHDDPKAGKDSLDELLERAVAQAPDEADAAASPAPDAAGAPVAEPQAAPEADAAAPEADAAAPEADGAAPEADGAAPEAEDAPRSERQRRRAEREVKARRAFAQLTQLDDEEGDEEGGVSFRTLLGGDLLGGRWFRRQLPFIFFLALLAILYSSSRYACQRQEILREDLADTLTDRKFKALTISSDLTEFSMRANVEENVPDSTLRTSVKSSYYLTE